VLVFLESCVRHQYSNNGNARHLIYGDSIQKCTAVNPNFTWVWQILPDDSNRPVGLQMHMAITVSILYATQRFGAAASPSPLVLLRLVPWMTWSNVCNSVGYSNTTMVSSVTKDKLTAAFNKSKKNDSSSNKNNENDYKKMGMPKKRWHEEQMDSRMGNWRDFHTTTVSSGEGKKKRKHRSK
jgi:hypothetical protein